MKNLATLESRGEFPALIEGLRNLVEQDRRAVTQKWVKHWMARRWRNLFLSEAVKDPVALAAATGIGDTRPARERIARRFLFDSSTEEWTEELPPVEVDKVPNTTLVLSPGLLTGFLPQRAFGKTLVAIGQRYDMPVVRALNNPLRSSEANVADLERTFDQGLGLSATGEPLTSGRRPGKIMLIGYSKGCVDGFRYLVTHPEIKSRIACFYNWAGPVLGTPIADRGEAVLRKLARIGVDAKGIRGNPPKLVKRLLPAAAWKRFFERAEEYDIPGAIHSLTTRYGEAFFAEHGELLDSMNIPFFFLAGVTSFWKVPLSQKLAYLDLAKSDPHNDMQVPASRAKVDLPMASHLSLVRGHHWDMAYPSFSRFKLSNGFHAFPRGAALAAMVQLAAELGLID